MIKIENTTVSDFKIMLNDYLIDMDRSVIVTFNGMEIFNEIVPRVQSTILETIKEYWDPTSVYYGEISISQVYINEIDKEKFSEKIFIIKNIQLLKAFIRDILS